MISSYLGEGDICESSDFSEIQVFGKFTYRVIQLRLNLGNRTSNLGDHRGGAIRPPPSRMCNSPDSNGTRLNDAIHR